ncbi:hypothetical protein OHS18_22840 [Amycolatopsis sp. NBC_00355]|uniref:hypothetical protein n=1 Tax=Amycolatopsis sp. NBC_00355 TaxID=2975957 RepID=UPI002E265C1B
MLDGEVPDEPQDEKSVSEGISAAASSPGSTAVRGEQVRQARQSFAFLGDTELHDAVAGNKYQYTIYTANSASTQGVHELSAEFVAWCRKTLVQPEEPVPDHRRGDSLIEIYRAAAGCGRTALAVWSLAGPGSGKRIFRVDPRRPLNQLSPAELPKSVGYLLEDPVPDFGTSLTAFDLTRLAAELEKRESRMIITVKSETTFADSSVHGYVREIARPPTARRVLESHLNHLLRNPRKQASLLTRADVTEFLDRELPATGPLRKAAELARLIQAEADRPDGLVAIVGAQLKRADENEFVAWFDDLGDLRLHCFAISLAVFNGLPYEAVADASQMLHRKFDVAGGTAVATRTVPAAANPFGESRGGRLRKLRAQVRREVVRTTWGQVPAEVISYLDETFPPRVLQHVWREHDGVREGLISWLHDLGGHRSLAVRVRAATAAGMLATIAYDHVRAKVLSRWASSRQQIRRESAAVALAEPAESGDPRLVIAAHSLAREWAHGSPAQRATAARAYGRLGLSDLEAALHELETLSAGDSGFDVVDAVCQSLAELVAADAPGTTTLVLRLLTRWSKSRQTERRTVAGYSFLLLAADLVLSPAEVGGKTTWPSLLWYAHTREGHRPLIAQLWADTLNSATTAALALTVLDEWAALAEHDRTVRHALAGLLRSACRSERVAARLRRQATGWATSGPGRSAPQTAKELLTEITGERTGL